MADIVNKVYCRGILYSHFCCFCYHFSYHLGIKARLKERGLNNFLPRMKRLRGGGGAYKREREREAGVIRGFAVFFIFVSILILIGYK